MTRRHALRPSGLHPDADRRCACLRRRPPRSVAFTLLLAAGCAGAPPAPTAAPPPDAASRVVAQHGVVSSANALASEAGIEILKAGGNAVDAAVATAFAIGVVEPQMSGLGGGGAMTIWVAKEGKPYYLDFYAAQQAAAFQGHTGPYAGAQDLRIVGVPGEVAGLLAAHERFGRLPLERVMAPAIRLAATGYPIGQVLGALIASDSVRLHRFDEAAARWWPNGRPLPPGSVFRNDALARTLRLVAQNGRAGFYAGTTAQAIVKRLNDAGNPTTLEDFAAYMPQWKRPLCSTYRDYAVLSAPPPQTGMQLLETLELLEPFRLPELGLPTRSARAFDVLASALRVAMADAGVDDDPRWAPVPARGVASGAFASVRRALVGTGRPPPEVEAGEPARFDDTPPPGACARYDPYPPAAAAADGAAPAPPDTSGAPGGETTHISVVDAAGNAVALTQTNSDAFGSGAWVGGFFLNDSGYIWTAGPIRLPPNTAWRTRRSTISPTIVVRGGRVRMVIGAPGGARIPTALAQVMVYVLDYGMDPLDAVRMPRIFPSPHSRKVQLERGFPPTVLRDIRVTGYDPTPRADGFARIYLVTRGAAGWIGVADPRHDGQPRGY